MFWEGERKLVNPDKSHMDIERTIELSGANTTHYTTLAKAKVKPALEP